MQNSKAAVNVCVFTAEDLNTAAIDYTQQSDVLKLSWYRRSKLTLKYCPAGLSRMHVENFPLGHILPLGHFPRLDNFPPHLGHPPAVKAALTHTPDPNRLTTRDPNSNPPILGGELLEKWH